MSNNNNIKRNNINANDVKGDIPAKKVKFSFEELHGIGAYEEDKVEQNTKVLAKKPSPKTGFIYTKRWTLNLFLSREDWPKAR